MNQQKKQIGVRINLNGFGESIEILIAKKLNENKLPECFGQLSPPLLKNSIIIPDTEFKMRFEISEEESVENLDISKLTDHPEFSNGKKFSITKSSYEKLEIDKENMIEDYINHVLSCLNCKFREACFQISLCYIQSAAYNKMNGD